MILPDFKAFPRTGRILGVDWGLSRIGLAVSDGTGDFVFTRPVIQTQQVQFWTNPNQLLKYALCVEKP